MPTTVSIQIGATLASSKVAQGAAFSINWDRGSHSYADFRGITRDGTWTPAVGDAVQVEAGGPIIWKGTVDEVKTYKPDKALPALYHDIRAQGYERSLSKRVMLNTNYSRVPCVPDAAADSIEILAASNRFQVGDMVMFSSAGTLAGNIAANTVHYVVARTFTHVQVSLTLGGSVLDITTTGSGQHFIFWCAGTIFTRILPTGEGLSAGTIRAGAGIESFASEYTTVFDAYEQLAQASGYVWDINPATLATNFRPASEVAAPFSVAEDSSDVLAPGVSFRRTREVYGNKIHLLPSDALWPLSSQVLTGNGAKRIFELGFPLKDLVQIARGGTVQTVGLYGSSGSQWYYMPGNYFLFQDPAETVLAPAETATVLYLGIGTNAVTVEDAAEIAARGTWERVVSSTASTSTDAANAASAELAAAKVHGIVAEYETKTAGLRPAMAQAFAYPSCGVGSVGSPVQFVIESVRAEWESVRDFRYRVTAHAGTRVKGYADFYRSLGSGSSAGGSTSGGGGTGGGAVDLIHIQEETLSAPTTAITASTTPSVGHALYVFLTQDATGGREITWGSDFATGTSTLINGDALSVTRCHFVALSDSKWHLVSFSRFS